MPAPLPAGFDPLNEVPFFALAVKFAAGLRPGSEDIPLVLVGSKLEATVSAGTTTIAAGTAELDTLVDTDGIDDIRAKAGAGSELFCMAEAVFEQVRGSNKRPHIKLLPITQGTSAVKAAKVITFGAASASGTLDLWVGGRKLGQIAIPSGQAGAATATAVKNAINAKLDWPVTATSSSAALTITCRTPGPRGNAILVRGISTATGCTLTPAGGSAVYETSVALAGGDVVDDITDGLAECASERAVFVLAQTDADNLEVASTHVSTYSQLPQVLRSLFVSAYTGSADGTFLDNVRNKANSRRGAVAHAFHCPHMPGEIAAALATGLLYGDGIGHRGWLTYPAENPNGLVLRGIYASPYASDAPLIQDRQSCYQSGATPLVRSTQLAGRLQCERVVASDTTNAQGAVVRPTDLMKTFALDWFAGKLESRFGEEFSAKNIADEPAKAGTAPPNDAIVYPSMIRGVVLEEYVAGENPAGVLQATAATASQITVERYDAGTVLVNIPTRCVDHLHVLTGNVSEVL